MIDMSFQKELKKLQTLERQSVRYYESLKNPMNSDKLWWDMSYDWEQQMDKVKSEFPEQWKEHCKEEGLVENYTFGDVLA